MIRSTDNRAAKFAVDSKDPRMGSTAPLRGLQHFRAPVIKPFHHSL
jgi:hypothetical protein